MTRNQEIQKEQSGELVSASQFSIKDFQSFYYKFNAKPDRETKFFREDKIVSSDEIIELNEKIQEKIHLHDAITTMTNIVVSFNNDRTLEFSNWALFRQEKWTTSAIIRSIIITWDFTIKLTGYEIPQRHTVKFRIGTRLKPKDLMELVWNHDDEFELHEAFAHSICTIDFINPLISSEIFLIIENWHKSLPDNFYSNKIYKYLTLNASRIEHVFVFLVLLTGCLLAFGASKVFFRIVWTNNFDQQFYYRVFGGLLLSFLFIHVLYVVAKSWSRRSVGRLERLKPSNIFKFTRGDNNQNEKSRRQNEGIVNKILIKLLITLVLTVLAFFSSHLFDLITKVIRE